MNWGAFLVSYPILVYIFIAYMTDGKGLEKIQKDNKGDKTREFWIGVVVAIWWFVFPLFISLGIGILSK